MKKLLILVICIFLCSLISAQPPVTQVQEFSEGYIIEASPTTIVKQQEDYTINFFVYNISNGMKLTNDTTACLFYIADSQGNLKFSGDVPYNIDNYWSLTLNGNNFSNQGIYPYGIKCNETSYGGAVTGYLEVTGTGFEFTTARSIMYLGLLTLLVFVFLLICIGTPMLPGKDNYDEEGTLISINQLKYIRPVLWFVAWFILLGIMFVTSNVALAYMGTELMGNVFFTIFQVMMALSFPMVLIWFIYIFYNLFQDKEMKKHIERGWEGGI